MKDLLIEVERKPYWRVLESIDEHVSHHTAVLVRAKLDGVYDIVCDQVWSQVWGQVWGTSS